MTRFYSSVASEKELSSPIDNSTQSISLDDVTGLPNQFPYTLIIDHNTATEEIVNVTAAAGTTLTADRGVDGTVGLAHEQGAKVVHSMTARDLQESRDHEDASTNVHGVGASTSVVGTDTVQTLEGKTIDGGANTLQNVPQSSITDLVTDQATQDGRLATNEGNISSVTTGLSNHENATAAHGVGEVMGVTEAQTPTNKTLDGNNNTFQNVPQSAIVRGVLNLNGDGTNTQLSSGQETLRTTLLTGANVGGFGSGGAGSTSAERTLPFDGLYLVTQDGYFIASSDTAEEVQLRLWLNGTPGALDGDVISRSGGVFGGTNEAFVTHVDVIGPMSAGDRLKFTALNTTSVTIEQSGSETLKHVSIVYLGPA